MFLFFKINCLENLENFYLQTKMFALFLQEKGIFLLCRKVILHLETRGMTQETVEGLRKNL